MIFLMIVLLILYWSYAISFYQSSIKSILKNIGLLFIATFYNVIAYILYFYDAINGITFILFIFTLALISVLIIIYKKAKSINSSNLMINTIIVLAIIISVLEFPLVKFTHYDSYATYYWESLELIEGTNLNMLGVGYKLYSSSDSEAIEELNEFEIYNNISLTNLIRYYNNPNSIWTGYFIKSSKNTSIENAEQYLGYEAASIQELKLIDGLSGDSAGLVMVLSALVTDLNINNNLSIAVTGAIDKYGKVYPIGSVHEKIKIAINDNHEYVIIPKANYQEARETLDKIGDKIKIIPVNSVEEAFEEIKGLNMN